MSAAAGAVDLDPRHAVAAIDGRVDGAVERIPEAWPTRPALELRIRGEQRLTAAGTAERAAALFHIERAAAGPFGSVFPKHAELFWGECFPPLRLGLGDDAIVVGHVLSVALGITLQIEKGPNDCSFGPLVLLPAATYSPMQLPTQYHRR